MRTLPLWSLALSCGLALGAAGLARAEEPAEPDHGRARTAFVTILGGHLQPEVQRIHAGEAFGWLNYTNKIARVSFAKDVAKHLTCKSQGSFRLTGDRLESGDIQAQQFATLCNLGVGEYPYRVVLRSGIGGGGGDVGTTREGRLVVE